MEDKKDNRITIIYHSGSGSTKLVSSVLSERLGRDNIVDMVMIRPGFDYNILSSSDLVIIGFPTYNLSPSSSALEFAGNMPVMDTTAFFLFTTYALYSGNSIRILSDILQDKKGRVIGYTQIRGPASDGALLFPSIKSFFRYEKSANRKIDQAVKKINNYLINKDNTINIPWLRWYSPFTKPFSKQLSKINYSHYSANLKVIEEECNNCNICVKNCIRGCWTEGKNHPSIDPGNCEFCLKCVHNCPKKAIILDGYMKDGSRLDRAFYKDIGESTFNKGQTW